MFDQLLVGAAVGDAITSSAIEIRDVLRGLGSSEIYAAYPEPMLSGEVHHLDSLPSRPNVRRPLIVHASIGCWPMFRALSKNDDPLILVYHNISPAESFAMYAPEVADDLVRGRWELEQIRDRVILSIADSLFNASELTELGFNDVHVIPPLPRVERFRSAQPDTIRLRRVQAQGANPLILCVGQQLPHKRIDRVIAASAVLQQEYQSDARLVIVGVDRFPSYSRALRAFAKSVGLIGDPFIGRLTDDELVAFMMSADLYLTLSSHEGFCVPVVEAMAMGTPVVAAATAAIPETVGDAAVLVSDPDDPLLVAALMNEVLTNELLRSVITGRGLERAERLGSSEHLARYVDLLGEFVGVTV